MDINEQKQQFSFAYVRAVASAAGLAVSRPDVDDDSVDLTIGRKGGGRTIRSPKLDVQVKCTGGNAVLNGELSFDLEIKNYDELRYEDYPYPRLLIVVTVPPTVTDWLHQTEDELCLRKCGYWLSLRSFEAVANSATKRIHIPRTQQFTVEQLKAIMTRIAEGGLP